MTEGALTHNTIDAILDEVVGREGGYVDHPSDKGGPTRWGITQDVARAFGYAGDMRALPRPIATDIYRRRYFEEPRFDDVFRLAPAVASELVDTGVNMGVAYAGRFLQRALNALNRRGRDYRDLTVDGRIGSMTLHALAAYLRARPGGEGLLVLLRALNCQQGERYLDISEAREANEDFTYGWLRTRVQ